jgi:phage terminase Nu1 subunit (DNA packaging protein)
MPEYISLREFARRKNVAVGAVQHALASGRIVRGGAGKTIDWATEEAAWENNRDESKVRDGGPLHRRKELNDAVNAGAAGDPMPANLAKAKLANAAYAAKLRKLEYERQAGQLIEKDLVRVSIFRFGREIRDQILNIPDRVAATVAADLVKMLEENGVVDASRVERIVRAGWDRESRYILENLKSGPQIKSGL